MNKNCPWCGTLLTCPICESNTELSITKTLQHIEAKTKHPSYQEWYKKEGAHLIGCNYQFGLEVWDACVNNMPENIPPKIGKNEETKK